MSEQMCRLPLALFSVPHSGMGNMGMGNGGVPTEGRLHSPRRWQHSPRSRRPQLGLFSSRRGTAGGAT